jgi:hypothetical protein
MIPSVACTQSNSSFPQDLAIQQANLIITARLVSFSIPESQVGANQPSSLILNIKPVASLKGVPPQDLQIFWEGGTERQFVKLKNQEVLVGIVQNDPAKVQMFGPTYFASLQGYPEANLPWVLNSFCAPPFLFSQKQDAALFESAMRALRD